MTELRVLQIETTNLCNSDCVFCPHSRIKEFGVMNDKLFKKILTEAKGIKSLEKIIPMLNGEPFTDPKFVDKLKLIRKILTDLPIYVFTNGSLITPEIINELNSIDKLYMIFSLNATNEKTRETIMGLKDYNQVINTIKLYDKTNKPYTVTMVEDPFIEKKELDLFKKQWKDKGQVIGYKNFAGKIYKVGKPFRNCHRAISQMTVLWNGKVNLCCMDGLGEVIFGDLNKQTIKDVWNSTHRQFYANAHLRGEIVKGLCEQCAGG